MYDERLVTLARVSVAIRERATLNREELEAAPRRGPCASWGAALLARGAARPLSAAHVQGPRRMGRSFA
jgi:hypothetical protein